MSRGQIQVGEWGFPIEIEITDQDCAAVDISTATTKQVIFTRPDKTQFTKVAAFTTSGVDGKIRYVVEDASIMNQAGQWYIQGVATQAGWSHPSSLEPFEVAANTPP